MRKMIKKVTSFILAGTFLMSQVVCTGADNLTFEQLQRKFPNGTYYNHRVEKGHDSTSLNPAKDKCNNPDGYSWYPCTEHFYGQFSQQEIGWYDCNRFNKAIQCYAFASKLSVDAYGTEFHNWPDTKNETEDIKPGDVIWIKFYDGDKYGHQAMIIDVKDNYVSLAEANMYGTCMITWGAWYSLDEFYSWEIYHAPQQLENASFDNIITEIKGDVDNDDNRTLTDVEIALNAALGIKVDKDINEWAADMDGNGKVGVNDVAQILKIALLIEWPLDVLYSKDYFYKTAPFNMFNN